MRTERKGGGARDRVSIDLSQAPRWTSKPVIRNNTGTAIGEHVGSTSYYYLHDNEGSVVAVISASGTVQNRYAYGPYGNLASSSGTLANPLGYAGGYTDSATGLVKFGTRYYDPLIGRFTQEDPSGQTAGYIYVGDSPVNGTDLSGMSSVAEYAENCGEGAATGLAIGLAGADETVGGAVVAAVGGCVKGLLETAVDSLSHSALGTIVGGLTDVADALDL